MPNSQHHRADPSARVAALSSLLQAEITANIGALQATTAIALGMLAYLGATIAFLPSISMNYLLYLPAPLVVSCFFQMLQAAVVIRRAQSANVYEIELARAAEFGDEVLTGELGSRYYGVDDINAVWRSGGSLRVFKVLVSIISYIGMYGLAVGYTLIVILRYAGQHGHSPTALICASTVYGILWAILVLAAIIMLCFPGESDAIRRYERP